MTIMADMFKYNPEQEEILKARALKILEGYITDERVVHTQQGVFRHLTQVRFIKDDIFYTFFFWAELSQGKDVNTIPFSFEFSKGIPNTKTLLSRVLTMEQEPSFIKYLAKFVNTERIYV